jgi:hypothetical protein
LTHHHDPAEIAGRGLSAAFFEARYDFAAAEPAHTGAAAREQNI